MIITDIRMPDMSGIELANLATQRQKDLKIILISGYFVSQQVERRFLRKPFRMRDLEAAVREELRNVRTGSRQNRHDARSALPVVRCDRGRYPRASNHRLLTTDTQMMDRHVLSNGTLSATIKADGAELCSLRDAAGEEMLWQAGPAWPRHAPVLFPIVGRLKDDRLRHQGRSYRLTQHGFARDRRFAWLNRSATACRLVLHEDAGYACGVSLCVPARDCLRAGR